jgi:hypothetical protein
VLALAADVALQAGDRVRAEALAGELLVGIRERGLGYDAIVAHVFGWTMAALNRTPEFREVLAHARRTESPWIRVAALFAAGDARGAADECESIGAMVQEARARLAAAAAFVQEGRRAEADGQLRRALPFFRSVGAKRYVREGEALLPASA